MPEKKVTPMIRLIRCVVAIAVLLLGSSLSFAMHADVVPSSLFPGDVFLVKVTGIDASVRTSALFEGIEVPLEDCGQGCLSGIGAVSIDTKPGERGILVTSGRERTNIALTVGTPRFPELHLKLPESKVSLSAEDLERVKKEEAMLAELWKKGGPRLFRSDFIMPLPNQIATVFGARRILNEKAVSVHRGIDVKGRLGEKVAASNAGRVVLAKNLFFGGNTLIVDHGAGIYTIYMHLEKFAVSPGDVVARGDTIGLVGATGRATGPHLHFGVKILTINVNPVALINLRTGD